MMIYMHWKSNATEAIKVVHRELRKKDGKYLFIYQCVDQNIFEKNIKE